MESSRIKHLKLAEDSLHIFEYDNLKDIDIESDYASWIHITSSEYEDVIKDLVVNFDISSMVLDDIKNSNTLPKVEDYNDYIFMVLEDISLDLEERLQTKQLSLILFENIIISIEERESNIFDKIAKNIEDRKNPNESSADIIFAQLVDITVEDYFSVLESIGEKIDEVEDKSLLNPKREILEDIYFLKKSLISTRKTLWLMRNAINKLIKNEFNMVGIRSLNYFREIYDDLVQLVDLTETYRDICSGMLDIYLSSISNKTNDIMKVLTILSTIFIPLTFMAGVYGMNFRYFPELQWEYGYLGFWVLSIIITGFMVRFFKRKKWL